MQRERERARERERDRDRDGDHERERDERDRDKTLFRKQMYRKFEPNVQKIGQKNAMYARFHPLLLCDICKWFTDKSNWWR